MENLSLQYRCGDLGDKKFSETFVKDVDAVVYTVRVVSRNEYFKTNIENTKNLYESILEINLGLKSLYLFLRRRLCPCQVLMVLKKLRIEIIPFQITG